jgi:hypothetical protein
MRAAENAQLWDGLARYVGSTCRRNIPQLKWNIELVDENDVHFNVPVLILPGSQRSPLCPLSLVTAALDRQVGNYMSTVAKVYQEG